MSFSCQIRSVSRQLPEDRSRCLDLDYGVLSPTDVPAGRYTLPQALSFITTHHANPDAFPVEAVAAEHKVDVRHMRAVLKHFHVLQLQMPATSAGHRLLEESQEGPQAVAAGNTSHSAVKDDADGRVRPS